MKLEVYGGHFCLSCLKGEVVRQSITSMASGPDRAGAAHIPPAGPVVPSSHAGSPAHVVCCGWDTAEPCCEGMATTFRNCHAQNGGQRAVGALYIGTARGSKHPLAQTTNLDVGS